MQKDYFYSDDCSDELENRLSKFECYIAPLITKIDCEEALVSITGKELYLLKLYCFLCACRQDNTTEVIVDDKSGYYRSNNYLFGIPQIHGKENIIAFTDSVVSEFERVNADKAFIDLEDFTQLIDSAKFDNEIRVNLKNLHLCILRNESCNIAFSDVFAIIENTMDGDHLYTYIPMSPKTAFCLVKTKYYLDKTCLECNKHRLPSNNGGTIDEHLSSLFQADENDLLCTYYQERCAITINESYITKTDFSNVKVAIKKISDEVIDYFNSIMFEDCNLFIFKDEDQLNKSKRKLEDSHVVISF